MNWKIVGLIPIFGLILLSTLIYTAYAQAPIDLPFGTGNVTVNVNNLPGETEAGLIGSGLGGAELAAGSLGREANILELDRLRLQEFASASQKLTEAGQVVSNQRSAFSQEVGALELARESAAFTAGLNPLFTVCKKGTDADAMDVAIFQIKGRSQLGKVVDQLNGEKNIEIQLINDLNTASADASSFDTAIQLLGFENPFVGGKILVGHKDVDFDIDRIDAMCGSIASTKKLIEVNNQQDQLILSDKKVNPVFQKCVKNTADTDQSFDYARYRIIGQSAELNRDANNLDGTVDLTLYLLVDLFPGAPPPDPLNIAYDNKVISARLIVDEGDKNDERNFNYNIQKISTACHATDLLQEPLDIADDDELLDPIRFFVR